RKCSRRPESVPGFCFWSAGFAVSTRHLDGRVEFQCSRYLCRDGACRSRSSALPQGARPGCDRRAAVCARHDAPAHALCDFDYGLLGESVHTSAPRAELWIPLVSARRNCYFHPLVSAVRQVLSRLSASRTDWSEVL